MTNHELIVLALEQLRDGSYSPERRERCQGLIEEVEMGSVTTHGDNSPQGVLKHWEKKTKQECAREILRCWKEIERLKLANQKIVQVSGFGVNNTSNT